MTDSETGSDGEPRRSTKKYMADGEKLQRREKEKSSRGEGIPGRGGVCREGAPIAGGIGSRSGGMAGGADGMDDSGGIVTALRGGLPVSQSTASARRGQIQGAGRQGVSEGVWPSPPCEPRAWAQREPAWRRPVGAPPAACRGDGPLVHPPALTEGTCVTSMTHLWHTLGTPGGCDTGMDGPPLRSPTSGLPLSLPLPTLASLYPGHRPSDPGAFSFWPSALPIPVSSDPISSSKHGGSGGGITPSDGW